MGLKQHSQIFRNPPNLVTVKIIVFSIFTLFALSENLDLNFTLFQHLDPVCQLLIAHFSLPSEHFPLPTAHTRKGVFIVLLNKTHVPRRVIDNFNYQLETYGPGVFTRAQKSLFPCFIAIVLMQRGDISYMSGLDKPDQLRVISIYQTETLKYFMYYDKMHKLLLFSQARTPTNLPNSLLLRVQINIDILIDEHHFRWGIFKVCVILILRPKIKIWNRICLSCYSHKKIRVAEMRRDDVPHILQNHASFLKHLLPRPNDIVISGVNQELYSTYTSYGKAGTCQNYAEGPFRMIREKKIKPRATLFFALVCLGNFTYRQANAETDLTRRKESDTFREHISVDGPRSLLYIPTLNEGYSFMTCYSGHWCPLTFF
ncbi:hypothetical protein Fcan01_22406 [Folsomia candida]|uniref:Uncharacterized protein n=1 Tax=Folsomia candida TaxID=158441 RepID=A0A226DBQ9_FOLCA|nr:hypothetical protein Fcan01_22406 [Folsomia candida]